MDKLDAGLAARQIAWLADLATRLDKVSAAELRQGDPTLGKQSFTGNIVPSSATPTEHACGPAPAAAQKQKPLTVKVGDATRPAAGRAGSR